MTVRWLTGGAATLAMLVPSGATGGAAPDLMLSPAQVPSALHAALTTDRSTYAPGDQVRLRITLTNTSDRSFQFARFGPYANWKLIVTDAGGHAVDAAPAAVGVVAPHHLHTMGPGSESFADAQGNMWLPLAVWGYTLTAPGIYRIQAVFRPDERIVSNSAPITIR